MIIDDGRNLDERSCILIEEGQFYGMGYIPADLIDKDSSDLKKHLTQYSSNDYIKNLIFNYSLRFPLKIRSKSTSISTEIPDV